MAEFTANTAINDRQLQLSDDLQNFLEKINTASPSYIKAIQDTAKKSPALVKIVLPELIRRRYKAVKKLYSQTEQLASDFREFYRHQLVAQTKTLKQLHNELATTTTITMFTNDIAVLLEQDPLSNESADSVPLALSLEDNWHLEEIEFTALFAETLILETAFASPEVDDEPTETLASSDEQITLADIEIERPTDTLDFSSIENTLVEPEIQTIIADAETVVMNEQMTELAESISTDATCSNEATNEQDADKNEDNFEEDEEERDYEDEDKDEFENELDESDEFEQEDTLEPEGYNLDDDNADNDNDINKAQAYENEATSTTSTEEIVLFKTIENPNDETTTFISELEIVTKVYYLNPKASFWHTVPTADHLTSTREETLAHQHAVTRPAA